jgi:hypothetical protein
VNKVDFVVGLIAVGLVAIGLVAVIVSPFLPVGVIP